MKLHTERQEVERFGVESESTFSIKTTAKAFDILSSGLYTDPILAIVRELSCNAYDAHVEAGNSDIPFEIHLPNDLEPWFSVKDFGTGLSDKQVMTLYTTYFDSTKTESNDFIGALGLGSKSPFSYANSFDVISRYNGERRTYTVYISETGVPTIARMGMLATDEPNGLEVKMHVERGDFRTFSQKTARALMWFPVKPIVKGTHHFKFDDPPTNATLSGDKWMLLPKSYAFDYGATMTAIQGNVAYNVNINKLNLDASVLQLLRSGHLAGFFDIGDLEVAANREEIRYNDRTIQALTNRIGEFQQQVLKNIEERADLMSSQFWYAAIELRQLSSELFGSPEKLGDFIKYCGGTQHPTINRYTSPHVIDGGLKKGEVNIITSSVSSSFGRVFVPNKPGTTEGWRVYMYQSKYSTSFMSASRHEVSGFLVPEARIGVFYNDMKTGGVARLKHFMCQPTTRYSRALVIRRVNDAHKIITEPDGSHKVAHLTEKEYQEQYNILVELLGKPDILTISTDLKPAPNIKSENGKKNLPFYSYGGAYEPSYSRSGYRRTYKVMWDNADPDEFNIEDGGLFFELRYGSRIMPPNEKHDDNNIVWNPKLVGSNLQTMINLINEGYSDLPNFTFDDLWGVSTLGLKKVNKRSNWYNIFELVKPLAKRYEKAAQFFNKVGEISDSTGLCHLASSSTAFIDHVKGLDKKSPFRRALEPLIDGRSKFTEQDRERVRFFEALFGDLCLDSPFNMVDSVDNDIDNIVFNERHLVDVEYPMLGFAEDLRYKTRSGSDLTALNTMFAYIEKVDNQRSNQI